MIALALIEGNNLDRAMFAALMTGGPNPFVRNAELVLMESPPSDNQTYEKLDGVIIDYDLKNTTGIEEAFKIKQRFPNLPVVLMSGHEHYLNEPERSLFMGVVNKDDIEGVFETVRELAKQATTYSNSKENKDYHECQT